jgi:hypothetical protein
MNTEDKEQPRRSLPPGGREREAGREDGNVSLTGAFVFVVVARFPLPPFFEKDKKEENKKKRKKQGGFPKPKPAGKAPLFTVSGRAKTLSHLTSFSFA